MSDFARLQELARDAGLAIDRPVNTAIPYISPETATVGDTLTCTMGEWTGAPDSYTYSWRHADDPTEIGAGDTYTTVAGDASVGIRCVVTATNDAGSTAAPPSNTVDVAAAARSTSSRTSASATGATGSTATSRSSS